MDIFESSPFLSRLDAPELARLCSVFRPPPCLEVWAGLLRRDLLIEPSRDPCRQYAIAMKSHTCHLCHQRLHCMRRGRWNHCVCIAARGTLLPLKVASLRGRNDRRVPEGNCLNGVSDFPIFSEVRSMLCQHFDLSFAEADLLTPDLLREADILILDMVAAPNTLQHSELIALCEFVKNGGYAVLSAFSNWSLSGDFHASCVQWLNISTVQHSPFHRRQVSSLQDAPRMDVRELLHGPFGEAQTFVNVGETDHVLGPEVVSEEMPLEMDVGGAHSLTPRLHLFALGQGEVLVHSNLHWLTDADGWNGGTIHENRELVLNLFAAACGALLQ